MTTDEPQNSGAGATNWGRWGDGDQRGTTNLLSSDVVLRALAAARLGRVYQLGLEIKKGMPLGGPRAEPLHLMAIDGGDFAALGRDDWGAADDYLMLATGGTTHIDGLSHMWFDGAMYNGHDFRTVRSSGAGRLGVEHIGGIVTRAHLLDFAANPPSRADGVIETDDVERYLVERDVTVESGDALLFRTGWMDAALAGREREGESFPSVGADVGRFVAEHDIVLVGADNIAVERDPGQSTNLPLHKIVLRDLGGYLVELLDLSAPAADGVTSGMLVLAPLRIHRGVNSPVNPLLVA
jgi:kynurenine formamidase